jgi:isoquinoline 1-oxidoreductase
MSGDPFIEVERYELQEEPFYEFDLSRRDVLKIAGSGLVAVCLVSRLDADDAEPTERREGALKTREIGAWVHIGKNGTISAYTGKVEVGQDIRTSLTQVVAEELRVSMEAVHLVMADTHLTPYDRGTFGSQTTPSMVPQLRRAGAAARNMLIDLANERWKTDRKAIIVADGRVLHPDKEQTLSFGELTKGQRLVEAIASDADTTQPEDWKVCGKPARKINGRAIVTGRHRYTPDVTRPGMLHGRVLRPPSFEASLQSIDLSRAKAIDGVTVVHDGNFVGVAASNEFTASRALGAIQTEWLTKPQSSHKSLYADLKSKPTKERGSGRRSGGRNTGSIEEGLQQADHQFKQSYTIAYIAHAPLEPRAAVAEWTADKLTVWTGTQRPFGVRDDLARAFGLDKDRIRVITPDTGSGYGGKHTVETAVEAARLAKAAGKPVRVVWTREEEFTWAYFRPAGVIDVESGAKKDGRLTAWRFHNYNSGGSAIQSPYKTANQEIEFHGAEAPLRQGSYRALAATANHFARETHIDEIARTLKLDPLQVRMKNLDNERIKGVLTAAAERFGWEKKKESPDRGVGIACGTEKGSYVATCVEVSVDRRLNEIRVERLITAFDCGPVINPNNVKNQVEGAVIMGIGGALYEAIEFENGKILNPRFSQYRVPRFADAPPVIETVLVEPPGVPSVGAGETPIVAVAPAIGNALFDAIGHRARSMPMKI